MSDDPHRLDEARAHFAEVDPIFFEATRDVTPIDLSRPRDPALALMRAIVGQQLSIRAAASIWARVEDHFDGNVDAAKIVRASPDALRALGLSWRKVEYFQGVAQHALDGRLTSASIAALSDDEAIEALTSIRGVGRWTVEMILMFGQRRPDIFAAGDLGLQQAIEGIHGVTGKGKALERALREVAAPWSPYRSAASRLLWAWHREHWTGRS